MVDKNMSQLRNNIIVDENIILIIKLVSKAYISLISKKLDGLILGIPYASLI